MKVNELMIGDWVQGDAPSIVDALSNEGICTCQSRFGYTTTSPSRLQPIPITPKILEKNGFEIRGKRKYFLVPNDPSLAIKREPCIGANGNSFLIGHFWERNKEFRWFVEINYIHELQHALRLCGINKEIVL